MEKSAKTHSPDLPCAAFALQYFSPARADLRKVCVKRRKLVNILGHFQIALFSSSAFPAISVGFTILLLRSQPYLWVHHFGEIFAYVTVS